MYKLRDYQTAGTRVTINFLQQNPKLHGLVVMPTGSGKSISIADLIKQVQKRWPVPVLLLSHVKEILVQDYEKLSALLPEEDIQIYSASLKSKKKGHITLGSVQTVVNNTKLFSDVRLIIVDECHLIQTNGEGAYNKIFQALPKARIVGYTATPFRYKGHLTDPGHIFDRIIYDVKIQTLIDKGYLSKIFAKETKQKIDTSKLKVIAGDYSKKSLSEQVDRFGITKAICDDMLQFKKIRKHWLIFCVSIDHAKHVAEYLSSVGVVTMAVHSKMETWERDLVIRLYKEGKLQAIAQVNILSVGFDYPEIDLIGMMRPTKSQVLHRQSSGRGLRIAPGKKDCHILDYAGNFERLGPIDTEPEFQRKGKGTGGIAPTRTCPICEEIVPLSVKVCPDCGFEFPVQEKLTPNAKAAAVLSSQITERKNKIEYKVHGIFYGKTQKEGKPPVLKVTYKLKGLLRLPEWVGLQAAFPPIKKAAVQWWFKRKTVGPIPRTIDEALTRTHTLKVPSSIIVNEEGKYPQIVEAKFND